MLKWLVERKWLLGIIIAVSSLITVVNILLINFIPYQSWITLAQGIVTFMLILFIIYPHKDIDKNRTKDD